jgi:hypothetical protein
MQPVREITEYSTKNFKQMFSATVIYTRQTVMDINSG